MLPEGIENLPITQWTNKHENFTQTVTGKSFKLYNPKPNGTRRERYQASTKNFQWLIHHAKNNALKLRAMGSGWSFTKVGVTEGGIVDTASLNFSFPITAEYVSPLYNKTAEDLYFLQCGCLVYEINNRLASKTPKRSLQASGASNGQTIAGATSTGTHGAGVYAGAVHDFIVGLHIITDENKHIWLERATYPVMANKFIDWLDTELVQDDDLFNAAVVSFGSFGFIHGIMMETAPAFLLEEHRLDGIAYTDALKSAMSTMDFTGYPLPGAGPSKELYHFEVLVNPHKFEINNPNKGVFFKLMYKKQYTDNYPKIPKNVDFVYGDDLLGLISTVLDALGDLTKPFVPGLVNTMFSTAYKAKPVQEGTVGEIFTYTKFRGKVASAAIGMDIKDAPEVLETILQVNEGQPLPGGLSLRFVKGTKATLGFTKFPTTCVLEIDGVDSNLIRDFCEKTWLTLEAKNIPYTLHWGKINFILNENRVKKMYGETNVNQWLSARNTLLSPGCQEIFSNDFIKKCGLHKPQGAIV